MTGPADRGFIAWEGDVAVAALTTRQELGLWLEQRLERLPGEVEREMADRAAAAHAEAQAAEAHNVEDFPKVVRPRPEPRKRYFGIVGG